VKLRVAWIGKTKESAIQGLSSEYLKRIARYNACEGNELASEASLLKSLDQKGRMAPVLVLMDSRGKQVSSEELAEFVRGHLERGTQELVFAIGPSDGWSESTLARASVKLSLGKMTLPHELARVVLLEQVYRSFTILAGHPYHGGH
jgi:23S rRNA (pseudouridine1915-N3)-methyltransferase